MAMTRKRHSGTAAREGGTHAAVPLCRHAVMPSCRYAAMPLCLILALVTTSTAQEPARNPPWPVQAARVVKWPGLAATTALLVFGVRASNHAQKIADDATDQFIALCKYGCPQNPLGNFDPQQMLAQNREYQDARAHSTRLIVAGEVSLVATGAMFLIDLIHRDDGPRNIPFTPFTIYATPRHLGFTARF